MVKTTHAALVVSAAAALLALTCIVIGSAQLRSNRAVLLAKPQAKQARLQALDGPNAVSAPPRSREVRVGIVLCNRRNDLCMRSFCAQRASAGHCL
jgi:hypothetical protein